MDQNKPAISALHEYVKIKKPRYAFMIEAPWGAGKTYLVKREFKKCLKSKLESKKARYVTLNGISDRKAFQRVLLADSFNVKLSETLGNTFGKIAKIDNLGSLARDAIENKMIKNLPDLLIFDDVERCEMPPGELLGLVNEFVEHQTRNVVLCGCIERDDDEDEKKKRCDFLSRKEKVVGRTVRIVADVRSALPEFIKAMPGGHGKKWFDSNDNDKLVLEIFSEADHDNLRVLRQCLHACGRVIDVLKNDLRDSTDAMNRFVRTYLALSMALATGKMEAEQLGKRNDYGCFKKPDAKKDAHPLYDCSEQHPQAEILAANATTIIPVDLGVSLIGIGYEEPCKINTSLRETGQFSSEQGVPLWRRFVEWWQLPKEELENSHDEAMSYIFESEEIKPGPYLHVANVLVMIAENGCGNGSKIAKEIKDRITQLSENGNIPAAAYG